MKEFYLYHFDFLKKGHEEIKFRNLLQCVRYSEALFNADQHVLKATYSACVNQMRKNGQYHFGTSKHRAVYIALKPKLIFGL